MGYADARIAYSSGVAPDDLCRAPARHCRDRAARGRGVPERRGMALPSGWNPGAGRVPQGARAASAARRGGCRPGRTGDPVLRTPGRQRTGAPVSTTPSSSAGLLGLRRRASASCGPAGQSSRRRNRGRGVDPACPTSGGLPRCGRGPHPRRRPSTRRRARHAATFFLTSTGPTEPGRRIGQGATNVRWPDTPASPIAPTSAPAIDTVTAPSVDITRTGGDAFISRV